MGNFLPNLIGVDVRRLFASEWEQALIRFVFTAIVIGYLLVKLHSGSDALSPNGITMIIAWSYLAFSVLVLFSFRGHPERSHARRIVTLWTDLAVISMGMYYAGELGAPFFTLLMWVAVGYGARYGRRYLVLSTVMASIFFTIVLNVAPFWSSHLTTGYGLLVALLVIPVFVFKLLGRIEKARADAEEANLAKTQFLANMSHEIRTPLTAIIGMADLLMDVALGKEQQEQVRAIDASAKTLLNLLEDVLDISKIEAGKIVLENQPMDLHGLVNSLSMSFKPVAHRKGLRFLTHIHPDVPYALVGDALRLRQVLMNLLGNAIKFTEKGYVELRLTLLSQEGDRALLRFDVVDTGVGIPEHKRARIFEQFEQADASITREYGGTGLGTSIALHLTQLMGGDLRVHSSVGVGTTFTVDVPFRVREVEPGDATESSFRGMRALLVSNRAPEIQLLAEHLGGWGIEVQSIAGSAKAFASLYGAENRGQGYGLVIVDELGCDISPQYFAGAVVAEERLRHLPLILLANPQGSADRVAGYSSVVPHPVQKPLLFNAVHAALVDAREIEGVARLSDRYGGVDPVRGSLRILVAEDNLTIQKVIRAILERGGHRVELVGNGEDALDRLEREDYDATIVDLQMPLMSGLDVLRAFRFGSGIGRRMPFIVLSANATPEAHRECEEAGVDAYLTKPVDPTYLLQTLDSLTRGKSAVAGRPREQVSQNESRSSLLDPRELGNLLQLGHGVEFIDDLFNGFAQDARRSIAGLEASLAAREYQQYRDIAHGLAGSASGVGAMRLYDQAHAVTLMDAVTIRSRGADIVDQLSGLVDQSIESQRDYVRRLQEDSGESRNEPPM